MCSGEATSAIIKIINNVLYKNLAHAFYPKDIKLTTNYLHPHPYPRNVGEARLDLRTEVG